MLKKIIFALLLVLFAGNAIASHPKLIGHHGKWSAYEMKEDGKKICYMMSAPIKQEGNFKKRGDVYVMITHRPASKSYNVVSFHGGYTFAKGSSVNVSIGKDNFELFTQGETAWTNDDTDGAIVNSIKKGDKITAKGKSSKGTETMDTYSLKGSSQAYQAINKACGL